MYMILVHHVITAMELGWLFRSFYDVRTQPSNYLNKDGTGYCVYCQSYNNTSGLNWIAYPINKPTDRYYYGDELVGKIWL